MSKIWIGPVSEPGWVFYLNRILKLMYIFGNDSGTDSVILKSMWCWEEICGNLTFERLEIVMFSSYELCF